jgi:hypothetical protein
MNLGSHECAFLNEHAVAQADGSMMGPQFALQSAPVLLPHASALEVLQDVSHLFMQSWTGSAAGLLSGMTMISPGGGGRTLVGMRRTGSSAGCVVAGADGCAAGVVAGCAEPFTVMSRGPVASCKTTTLPVGDAEHAANRRRTHTMTLLHKARDDIDHHHQQKHDADVFPDALTGLLLK